MDNMDVVRQMAREATEGCKEESKAIEDGLPEYFSNPHAKLTKEMEQKCLEYLSSLAAEDEAAEAAAK